MSMNFYGRDYAHLSPILLENRVSGLCMLIFGTSFQFNLQIVSLIAKDKNNFHLNCYRKHLIGRGLK